MSDASQEPAADVCERANLLLARQDGTWNVDVRMTMGELVARVRSLEQALKPFADIWNGNQDGTTRIPWSALKVAADVLAATKPPEAA